MARLRLYCNRKVGFRFAATPSLTYKAGGLGASKLSKTCVFPLLLGPVSACFPPPNSPPNHDDDDETDAVDEDEDGKPSKFS
nr:hypothetical protein [Tanacetum cinerariifolium]